MSVNLKKVLILEEEAVIALDIKQILKRAGSFFPVIIKNKKEIINSIINERPELIITSSNIFRVLTKRILKEFNIKVIFLDNIGGEDPGEDRADYEADVISKPFTADVLITKVEQLLGKNTENENVYVNA